jgi:hypothetical protein
MTTMNLLRWTIATVHLLGHGLGLGAIWSRSRALKDPSEPGNIQRVLFADTLGASPLYCGFPRVWPVPLQDWKKAVPIT